MFVYNLILLIIYFYHTIHQQFACLGSDHCDLSVGKRKECTKCRLERCFEIGMVPPKLSYSTDTSNSSSDSKSPQLKSFCFYKTIDHLPKLKIVTENLFGHPLSSFEQACLDKINTNLCGHFVDEFDLKVTKGNKSLSLILNTPSVYLREMVIFLNRMDMFRTLNRVDQLRVVKAAGYYFATTRLAYAYDSTSESYIIVTVNQKIFFYISKKVLFHKTGQWSKRSSKLKTGVFL